MNDAKALLKCILEDPACNTARLVYADCIEEQGEPDIAAWIRFSVAGEDKRVIGEWPRDVMRGYCLMVRFGLLSVTYDATKSEQPIEGHHLERGFVDRITIEPNAFMEYAGELFRHQPITSVKLLYQHSRSGWNLGGLLDTDTIEDFVWYRSSFDEVGGLDPDLWDLLDGYRATDDYYKVYRGEKAANDALGRACLKYGLARARITRKQQHAG